MITRLKTIKIQIMKAKLILSVMLLLGLGIASADAQIVRSQVGTKARVATGVKSGEITRPEAHRLRKEKRSIRKDIHRARKNDGHISARERAHIRHKQRKHSRHITVAKHNGRKRAIK